MQKYEVNISLVKNAKIIVEAEDETSAAEIVRGMNGEAIVGNIHDDLYDDFDIEDIYPLNNEDDACCHQQCGCSD